MVRGEEIGLAAICSTIHEKNKRIKNLLFFYVFFFIIDMPPYLLGLRRDAPERCMRFRFFTSRFSALRFVFVFLITKN